MPLLKLLHFSALSVWCGTLLYLPALIAAGTRRGEPAFHRDHVHILRWVFTLVCSPAALLAIASGTALFAGVGVAAAPWLVTKLAAVALLVLGHAACGVLILKIEAQPEERVRRWCALLGAAMALLVGAALWLVLAKPPL